MASLYALPAELKLKIFSELLLHKGPINLLLTWSGNLLWDPYPAVHDLWPAILRVNRQIYDVARLVLYSENAFQFPDSQVFAAFLDRIGTQDDMILRVSLPFPMLGLWPSEPKDRDIGFEQLDLLRQRCPYLQILELAVSNSRAEACFSDLTRFGEVLDRLCAHLESFQLLRKVTVVFIALQRELRNLTNVDELEDFVLAFHSCPPSNILSQLHKRGFMTQEREALAVQSASTKWDSMCEIRFADSLYGRRWMHMARAWTFIGRRDPSESVILGRPPRSRRQQQPVVSPTEQ
jgi:hypothetical protein